MGSMFKPGQQKTKTSSTASPWATQTPYLKDAFAQAQNTFRANQTPNQNLSMGWNLARDNALNPNSGFNKARDYYKGVIDSGGYDPNVWANISSPIIAGVTSQFMGSGRTGGGLEGINLTNELTKAYAPFAVNQVNNAAGSLPMLDANAVNGLVNAGQQEFNFPWQNLGNYYDIVGGGNWGGTTSGVNTTPTPSMGSQLIGAGVGLAGSALSGGMFSDIRLKENITRVGALDDGTTVYSYRYKSGGPVHLGVMAQDVEARYPDAVSTHESGFKMVDYGKLSAEIGG